MNTDTKTYLFDFDGTLVDSMPYFVGLMLRILDENGVKYEKDIVKIITPLGYAGTARYFRTLGIDATVDELMAKMQEYAKEAYTYKIGEKVKVTETLKILKENGAGLNILTASPHSALDPCLKRLGLFELFDNVWSCDDFGTTKSDPEIYRAAAERIGVDAGEVIFVDDNVNAVKTAKEGGMISYGIYDNSASDFVDQMKEVSDRYLMSFEELLSETAGGV